MEIRESELKRQLMAAVGVVAALGVLFGSSGIAAAGRRMVAALSLGGFRVTYYRGPEFGAVLCRRSEPQAVRDYPDGRACFWGTSGAWSARWEGVLTVPETAKYGFYLQSSGGARLFIDGQLVIDRGNNPRWNPGQNGSAELAQGQHRLRLEHVRPAGASAAVRLKWTGGGIPANTIMGVPHVRKPSEHE